MDMATLREEVRVDAPAASVRGQWPHFVEWVLVGPRRLVCDDLACVDATDSGAVSFSENDDGTAAVVFELPSDTPVTAESETGPGRGDDLRAALRHDLLLFKDYVESRRDPAHESHRRVSDETSRGGPTEQPGTAFDRSGLPADPSRRA